MDSYRFVLNSLSCTTQALPMLFALDARHVSATPLVLRECPAVYSRDNHGLVWFVLVLVLILSAFGADADADSDSDSDFCLNFLVPASSCPPAYCTCITNLSVSSSFVLSYPFVLRSSL